MYGFAYEAYANQTRDGIFELVLNTSNHNQYNGMYHILQKRTDRQNIFKNNHSTLTSSEIYVLQYLH